MSNDPLTNPLNELGHISLTAKQLSQSLAPLPASVDAVAHSTGRLSAGAEQVSRDLQHAMQVFAPILAELTSEAKRLRLEIGKGAKASGRSAWALVVATIALVLATIGMAWPIWFPPKAPAQATTPPAAVTSPAPKSN